MENRWLALVVTVVVSAPGYALSTYPIVTVPATDASLYLESVFQRAGILHTFLSIAPLNGPDIVIRCAFSWFIPIALRLGWLRAVLWIWLAAVGAHIEFALRNAPEFFRSMIIALPVLLPCLTLAGRRTRPWMAIPASVLFALLDWLGLNRLYFGCEFGVGYITQALSYAAILIFGTNLIPKKPATATPSD